MSSFDDPGQSPKAPGLRAALVSFFEKQRRAVLASVKAVHPRTPSKALDDEVGPGDAPDFDEEEANEALLALIGLIVADQVTRGAKRGLEIVAEAGLDFTMTESAVTLLRRRTGTLLENTSHQINSTTRKELRRAFEAAAAARETIRQLRERVGHIYDVATEARAPTIAHAESRRSVEAGKRAIFEAAAVKRMVWRIHPDACPFCRPFEGRTVTTSGQFAHRGENLIAPDGSVIEMVTDIGHPPLHPRCRCSLQIVVE